MAQFSFGEPPECGISEDCLYLNVWAPTEPAAKGAPVMVWLFGGGHRLGGGSHPVSHGANLAAKGAVVVTLNYRVGALGYIAHPALTAEAGSSGNYASMDILAALEWVKRNIAAFGGDPDCVTLFGQSAGATHVNALMASPAAKGLFHRAIAQSGGRFHGGLMGPPMKGLAEAQEEGAAMLARLGATTLEDIRNLPADSFWSQPTMWDLIVDGEILPMDVQAAFEQGAQHKMPLIGGMTAQEGSAYPARGVDTRDAFIAEAKRMFGAGAPAFLALYPTDSDADAQRWKYVLTRDGGFGFQAYKLSQMHARKGRQPVFSYFFERPVPLPSDARFREPVPPGGYGAYHASEIWYIFGNLGAKSFDWAEADRRLADQMGSYWVNFARTGDPNGPGLPHWPEYTPDAGRVQRLGEAISSSPFPNLAALQFYDRVYNPA